VLLVSSNLQKAAINWARSWQDDIEIQQRTLVKHPLVGSKWWRTAIVVVVSVLRFVSPSAAV
jgi:hypothetical protein